MLVMVMICLEKEEYDIDDMMLSLTILSDDHVLCST